MAGIGHFTNDGKVEFPFVEYCLRKLLAARFQDHQHALLTFGQHHFIRGHPLFTAWHFIHVENDAGFAISSHFHTGTG